MIDAPDRLHPRFPADQEEAAKEQIKHAIREIAVAAAGRQEQIIGMAGATDGGACCFMRRVPSSTLTPRCTCRFRS